MTKVRVRIMIEKTFPLPPQRTYAAALARLLMIAILTLPFAIKISAQSDPSHMLYGDLLVDESKADKANPITFDLLLYTETGALIGRQRISANGRYRFLELHNGRYDLVVELENQEVARVRVDLEYAFKTDVQRDITLAWSSRGVNKSKGGAGTLAVENFYPRTRGNEKVLEKAEAAMDKKDYDQAADLLRQIVATDAKDFPAWTELGTVYLAQEKNTEAEQAYLRAINEKPTYVPALTNLGRLRLMQKNYTGAVEVFNRAVKIQPDSAALNYYLGEVYLQNKQGSQAVAYFHEALKLDPQGKAQAHLRLAALYHAAGMKDKAAEEYAQFLVKKPDYPEKKKLRQYIEANRKPAAKNSN